MPTTLYSFKDCGLSGSVGPTQAQIDAAYSGTTLQGLVTSNSGVQSWVVPKTGRYKIEVGGAQGGTPTGYGANHNGGMGTSMSGVFQLTAGKILKILVGQRGLNSPANTDGGGGGGSFVAVVDPNSSNIFTPTGEKVTPLIVAGGGGGGSYNSNTTLASGQNASLTTSGTAGTVPGSGGVGGVNGNGGVASSDGDASAGGGFLTQGVRNGHGGNDYPGLSFLQGGAGGACAYGSNFGGFGGGGGSHGGGWGGGGGGGYSGGSTSSSCDKGGGGGGSYNSSTISPIVNLAVSPQSTGYVNITSLEIRKFLVLDSSDGNYKAYNINTLTWDSLGVTVTETMFTSQGMDSVPMNKLNMLTNPRIFAYTTNTVDIYAYSTSMIPKPQLVIQNSDINLAGKELNKITVVGLENDVRIAISTDGGVTWRSNITGNWSILNINDKTAFLANGMKISQINALTKNQLRLIKTNTIRFAYLLSSSDQVTAKKVISVTLTTITP